ncbi:MAG: hypothetical protein HOV83_18850 [Catenulispora sp.]|nr:hypothetical protein [Catenulispora sp.]
MRTFSISAPARRSMTRISALGVATATALALTACGDSGSTKKEPSTNKPASSAPGTHASSPGTPSTAPSFDPAAGPVVDAGQLPKNCNGLVTDADLQLALGNPLTGGDYFQNFQPDAGHKQTGRVKCQYGIVQDAAGKIASSQVEVQLATYADAASAQSRAAATVGTLAGGGAKYAQISVGGHPATYVNETGKDAVLVMYDGNRTFLITVQEALVKGEDAKAFTLKIGEALYKHTTPAGAPSPSGSQSASGGAPSPGASSGAPSSGAASSGAPNPDAPASSGPPNPAPPSSSASQ